MVTYDGEDVTSQAAITNVTTGEPVENAAWTTTEIGEYKFQAVYDSYTSDPVTVSAIDKNKDKEFYRYVLLLKFTYMTCGNCVTAQGYFDALDEADRDHFLVVAAHQPEGMPMDPYWCSEGISLKSKMKVGVYPTWSYNFEDLVVGIGAGAISKTSIRQQISHAEKTYPAVCGVKATSTLEGSTAKIRTKEPFRRAHFSLPVRCKQVQIGCISSFCKGCSELVREEPERISKKIVRWQKGGQSLFSAFEKGTATFLAYNALFYCALRRNKVSLPTFC